MNMPDLIQLNEEIGHYFFSPDTMRFFASKIESELYPSGYFITSEKRCFNDNRREFKVRFAKQDEHGEFTGEIESVKHDLFETFEEAKEFIENL